MEPLDDQRPRSTPDGLVSGPRRPAPMTRQFVRTGLSPRQGLYRVVRPMMFAALAVVLLGLAGGLFLLGGLAGGAVIVNAALAHGALMVCGFFGTVIGIERAVALRRPSAFLTPASFACGGIVTLLGMPTLGAGYFVLGAVGFLAVNVALLKKQFAAHTVLLVAAAAQLLVGSAGHLIGGAKEAVLALWFGFLLLTIAAERLEMARLMVRRPESDEWLFVIATVMAIGGLGAFVQPVAGAVVFGGAVAALAAWLIGFDIARRTVATAGLSRYMAVCLLSGYGWLMAGGIAWSLDASGVVAVRDLALHAIALGFVVAMVMAHAPVILPAVAGVKVAWHPLMYLPLAVLQGSLLLRFAGVLLDAPPLRLAGAVSNVVALLAFGATLAVCAGLWKREHRPSLSASRPA